MIRITPIFKWRWRQSSIISNSLHLTLTITGVVSSPLPYPQSLDTTGQKGVKSCLLHMVQELEFT